MIVSLGLVLALSAAAPGDGGADAALARPLSPGSVALLLEYVNDPRVWAQLEQGLRDPAPATRAAAARVANVTGRSTLVPVLAEVLAKEADQDAALEELDALITLDPQAGHESALPAARRLGGLVARRFADTVAAVRGRDALDTLVGLRTLELDDPAWTRFLEQAASGDRAALSPAVALALRERDARLWTALLSGTAAGWARVEASDLAGALERDDELRELSLRHLVSRPEAASAAPVAAVLARLESDTEPRSPALELLAREHGRAPVSLLASLQQKDEHSAWFWYDVASRPDVRKRLDAGELGALRALLHVDARGDWPSSNRATSPPPTQPLTPVSLATGYPPGFVRDTLAQSGCKPDFKGDLGGTVRRREDGRAREAVAFGDLASGAGCLRAARVLIASHLDRGRQPPVPGSEEYLLLPLAPAWLDCSLGDGPARAGAAASRGGRSVRGITEPRKIRSYAPRYPESARQARIQGVVIIEAVLSETGCVKEGHLLRGVYPPLDLEALRTVARWVYSPTLLDGEPVPAIMTTTVNFKLN